MKIARKFSKNVEAITAIICSCLLMSCLVAIVRYLSRDFHILFIIVMRNFLSMIFFLPSLASGNFFSFKTKNLRMHLLRGMNGAVSMMMWYYAIALLPLSESTSLTFVVPILTTVAATFILGEKSGRKIYIACLVSFVGVLIILRPGFRQFNFAHLFVLGAIILWTISNLLVKQMTKTEKPSTIVAYMSFFIFIISAPFALPHLQAIDLKSLCWFVALAGLSNLAHILLAYAFSKSPISVLQPFDFSRLIFTSLIAYFVFDEKVDIFVFLGSMVIFGAIIYSLPKRTKSSNLLS